jgi:hypothetical protein
MVPSLYLAVKHGYDQLVQRLFGSRQRPAGLTDLQEAAVLGNAALVQQLLRARGGVAATNLNSALWLAGHGHVAVVQLLLEAGADVNVAAGPARSTVLHVAAQRGHVAVVQLLLGAQAAVNATNDRQRTALHFAAQRGHVAIVQLLLEAQANVTAVNILGQTAMDLAAMSGHAEVVQLMLDATPQLSSELIATAARMAGGAGHRQLAMMLFELVMARGVVAMQAAASVLAEPGIAGEVLAHWRAAEERVRELEAREPALQHLLIGVAVAHKALRDSQQAAAEGKRVRKRRRCR